MKRHLVKSVILIVAITIQIASATPCTILQKSGDLNEDGFINILDLAILASAWLDNNCSSFNWCNCTDLDLSGSVNTSDIAILAENWLTSVFNGTIVLGRPTNTSITANLLSNTALETYLEYGTLRGVYTSQTDVNTIQAGTPVEAVIQNLQPNTQYYYRVCFRQPDQTEFGKTGEYTFHTQRSPGTTFVFDIQTDSHLYDRKCDPDLYQIAVQNELADAPDFLLDLGDTFGDDHNLSISYSQMLQLHLDQRAYIGFVGRCAPVFLCIGNHEAECGAYMNGTPNNLAIYGTLARQLYYPNPLPDSFYSGNTTIESFVGLPENYYSWQWGDALFVVLDAYRYETISPKPTDLWDWTLGKTQYDWFKQTLEQSNAKFKFVFAHHVLGQTRGAVVWADKYEWGGNNKNGVWEFSTKRPGWAMPLHQLMVQNKVTIFFQGHDHLFAKESLDGLVYQEVPMPSDSTYHVGDENAGGYTGYVTNNSGHLRVTVSNLQVKVDYIRAYLPQDQNAVNVNGQSAYSYTITANQ
jgi:hypothetical protein